MRKWQIIGPDHGRFEGQHWFSRVFNSLHEAAFEAAWLQQRQQLFGYTDLFTVVEVSE